MYLVRLYNLLQDGEEKIQHLGLGVELTVKVNGLAGENIQSYVVLLSDRFSVNQILNHCLHRQETLMFRLLSD